MTNGTAIVLGANAGQADLIRYLKERNWHVTAVSGRQVGDPGETLANEFVKLDIRDVDAVCDLARKKKAEIVYSISSDVAITAATEVSEKLGLPHFFDSGLVDVFNKKPLLREFLNSRGLSPVAFAEVTSADQADDWAVFPCVVKPTDAQGQRGVQKVFDKAHLAGAIEEAIANCREPKSAIIEAFLEGVEISCNVLVSDGEMVVSELSERLVHTGANFGIPIGHLIPIVHVPEHFVAEAGKLVEDVTRALGIKNGTLYYQMIVTSEGPRIVEIAPRLDGCHMWRLIKHSRGIDFLDGAVKRLTGAAVPRQDGRDEPGAVYELMFQQMPPGKPFDKSQFPVPADALYHEYRYQQGQPVVPVNGRLEVVGYYVRKR
ncbi:ATP-grasp domain-containing protein [Mesorhizobium sp. LHD-90]|uniref:ATP-grasp domain-containing protein n=1 Tax=Mesorhizobium sp. LHD-90 TaxID=3071414 RepID=UPI0027E0D1A9|nr:ATP-grasp domain-containing protein [Mesorhizobium sp. LHD-90]MDQ6437589.1 ATP-grasp domain-containing protein [Mesorhizobium sp. LHD-90]